MVYQCEDFSYQIIRKKVKNMTIRITQQQEVIVTVPLHYSKKQAEDFVSAKSGWVRKHLEQMENRQKISLHNLKFGKTEEEELRKLAAACLPAFAEYQIQEPTIKFRRMKTRWGSCNKAKGTITLNQALAEVPVECRTYVIVHELAHLVEANHQAAFYQVVASVLPEYKEYEKKLHQYALLE